MNVIAFNAKIRVQGQQVINSPLYMTVGPAELTTRVYIQSSHR